MAHVVIIGAGLTGISTAYHLEKAGFIDYKIFEKESEPGGLCRSIMQDGFTFDFTGHLLHTGGSYFRELIQQVVGLDQLNAIHRRSFIYSHNTYTPYPYQMNLFGLPPQTIVECIQGYINRPSIPDPQSFKEWVLTTFGNGFGEHFFFPYQEKIFAFDINTLTAAWTKNFVPKTTLNDILYGALSNTGDATVGYNAEFFYPKEGGIFSWVKSFAHQIKQPIYTNMAVQKIDATHKHVIFDNGHREPYDILINTMPLDRLLDCIEEPSASSIKTAQSHLKCNKVINFNLGINRPDLSDKHWIYFPEKSYPFYRLGFPYNFSKHMAPAGCSSLYGEFAHIDKSPEWVEKTLQSALLATKKLLAIQDDEIATQLVIPISHAYVIYDQWHGKQLPHLHTALNNRAIHSIGRYGEWKYASMQDSVLDGKKMAETIIDSEHNLSITPKKKFYEKISTEHSHIGNQHAPDSLSRTTIIFKK